MKNIWSRRRSFGKRERIRSKYFRGQVDKYTWVNYGSSYLPSDMNAAYLWAQLEEADKINQKEIEIVELLSRAFSGSGGTGMDSASFCAGICHSQCAYVLHKSKRSGHQNEASGISEGKRDFKCLSLCAAAFFRAGQMFGRFHGEDVYTTKESERLLRLPMYYSLSMEEAAEVVQALKEFKAY